jgi:hypothetical protein
MAAQAFKQSRPTEVAVFVVLVVDPYKQGAVGRGEAAQKVMVFTRQLLPNFHVGEQDARSMVGTARWNLPGTARPSTGFFLEIKTTLGGGTRWYSQTLQFIRAEFAQAGNFT